MFFVLISNEIITLVAVPGCIEIACDNGDVAWRGLGCAPLAPVAERARGDLGCEVVLGAEVDVLGAQPGLHLVPEPVAVVIEEVIWVRV